MRAIINSNNTINGNIEGRSGRVYGMIDYVPPLPTTTITGAPPLTFNSLDGSALSNWRIYGATQDRVLAGGAVGMGSSFNTTTDIRAHFGTFRIVKGRTYTFHSSDYTNYYYAVNTSTSTYPFTYGYLHMCDSTSGNWETADITFTASRTGYLVVNIGKPGDTQIALSDFEGVTMTVTEHSAGVGNDTGNILDAADTAWSDLTNGVQFRCVNNRFYAKGTATANAVSPVGFNMTGYKGTFYMNYSGRGRIYANVYNNGAWVGSHTAFTLAGNEGTVHILPVVASGSTVTEDDYLDICVSETNSFEPVGVTVPVTLNQNSETITLSEPLHAGDYIDFATWKRYNADGTSEDVTLPTLSTIAGTNTLSVGTTVQPSAVSITGRITAPEL